MTRDSFDHDRADAEVELKRLYESPIARELRKLVEQGVQDGVFRWMTFTFDEVQKGEPQRHGIDTVKVIPGSGDAADDTPCAAGLALPGWKGYARTKGWSWAKIEAGEECKWRYRRLRSRSSFPGPDCVDDDASWLLPIEQEARGRRVSHRERTEAAADARRGDTKGDREQVRAEVAELMARYPKMSRTEACERVAPDHEIHPRTARRYTE